MANRLEGINLNDANAIWARLNDTERKEFETIVQGEDAVKIIPTYHPWWCRKLKKPLIEEVSTEPSTSATTAPINHPSIFAGIVDFSKISVKAPATCVQYNLLNILAAYTQTVRFFVGEHMDMPHEATTYLYLLSANLKANINFNDRMQAIESVCFEAHHEGYSIEHINSDVLKRDIDLIVEGPNPTKSNNTYILAALSDVHQLFAAAKKLKKDNDGGSAAATTAKGDKNFGEFVHKFGDHLVANAQCVEKSKLSACLKKIEYFLAFVKKFQ